MKLWVLMNSKTICLQASKTKPRGEGVCVLVLQAAGRQRAQARGWGMHEVLRGAWLHPSTSTCGFALVSAGSKVHL